MAAAAAVVAASISGYIATKASAGSVACDLKRELIYHSGSPLFEPAIGAFQDSYQGVVYLQLAGYAKPIDQRREYAYLGIASINKAIIRASVTLGEEERPKLWPFPTDRDLADSSYIERQLNMVDRLDKAHSRRFATAYDSRYVDSWNIFRSCDNSEYLGSFFTVAVALLTGLSVVLIAIREFYKNA